MTSQTQPRTRLLRSEDRGQTHISWLDSYHSFSFGSYQNPNWVQFGPLRVINEDFVKPDRGFGTHGHRDMEIVTVVLEGELAHEDSMGNGSTIKAGDVQYMSAGTGVEHSEFNPLKEEESHFLQIWFHPDKTGYAPQYAQKNFDVASQPNQLHLIVSNDGRDDSIAIRQDVALYQAVLEAGHSLEHSVNSSRRCWIQVIEGSLTVNDQTLNTGDGIGMEAVEALTLGAVNGSSHFLLFKMG